MSPIILPVAMKYGGLFAVGSKQRILTMIRNRTCVLSVVFVLGLAIGLTIMALGVNPAVAQTGQARAQRRAVQMVAKPSLPQVAGGGGPAGAIFDPDFYVLFEDGTIVKKSGPFVPG